MPDVRRLAFASLAAVLGLTSAACGSGPSKMGGRHQRFSPGRGVQVGPVPRGSWSTYHRNNQRTGLDPSHEDMTPLRQAWAKSLDGAVYGEAVVSKGRIFAATEDDSVYGLSLKGKVIWKREVGTPLTHVVSRTGCGDIDPLGITSTPVLDPSNNRVYVVAEDFSHGAVHHQLVGIGQTTGKVFDSRNADPPRKRQSPLYIQQRAALMLVGHTVYVAYGGLYGDCGVYHGWVVGLPAGSGANRYFEVNPKGQGGAVWEAGGPAAYSSSSDIYFSTGNPNPTDSPARKGTESVIKTTSGLHQIAAFNSHAPGDEDLGSDSPSLLPNGTIFQIGKQQTGYFLKSSKLSHVASVHNVCSQTADGGNAFSAHLDAVFVPCTVGQIKEVLVRTHKLGWTANGINGPPILMDGLLWAVDWPGGTLEAINPFNGEVLLRKGIGSSVPNFISPSSADNLLLVGTDKGLTAFTGSKSLYGPALVSYLTRAR